VHRAEVAALWGVPTCRCPRPGKTAVEMFQAAADGEIKALWIACTNPAQSLPDQAMVRRALERCRVRGAAGSLRHHRHRAYADLLLPATTWGEKDGTVTNSERASAACAPPCRRPGQARARLGIALRRGAAARARLRPGAPATLFSLRQPESSGTSTARPRAGATWTSPA
jgi:assimilatory nitrate reductase catalytic subunit